MIFLSIMLVRGMFHFASPLIATTKDDLIMTGGRGTRGSG
jgi:hypothetical protein